MADKRCYYEVLGVSRTSTEVEITKAYRQLAKQYHPDRNIGDEEAKVKYAEVDEAYAILNDPNKRARYDRHGHAGLEGAAGSPPGPDLGDLLGDFIGSFFGGGAGGGRRPRGEHLRRSGHRPARGRDRHQQDVHGRVRTELPRVRRDRG
jgi:molecular chaperone DnaJ